MRLRHSALVLSLLLLLIGRFVQAMQQPLPLRVESLKFAVIGDNGTGDKPEYDIGQQMAAARSSFPFEMVMMLGDNMYGRQNPQDFVTKFERPYAPLLQAGVLFYATLGNHDNQSNRSYRGFNMGGERYYTYVKKNVRFLVLDSNQMDPKQVAWIDSSMKNATEGWRICYFHHPIYSDGGRHGSDVALRVLLEPLLVKYGITAVFSGHDHIYERFKPQKGITYFVAGSGGQLARGDVRPSGMTAAYFDQDQAFMFVEVAGDEMIFQARSRSGQTVDSGTIHRRPTIGEEGTP
jgi:predicted MPP superfamily phosphohydrolase